MNDSARWTSNSPAKADVKRRVEGAMRYGKRCKQCSGEKFEFGRLAFILVGLVIHDRPRRSRERDPICGLLVTSLSPRTRAPLWHFHWSEGQNEMCVYGTSPFPGVKHQSEVSFKPVGKMSLRIYGPIWLGLDVSVKP